MSKARKPGILCEYCNSRFDRGEYYMHVCECEKQANENSLTGMSTDQIVAHNKAVVKRAYSNDASIRQAYQNFDYK